MISFSRKLSSRQGSPSNSSFFSFETEAISPFFYQLDRLLLESLEFREILLVENLITRDNPPSFFFLFFAKTGLERGEK